jgi:arginyl-tRNA synthetase
LRNAATQFPGMTLDDSGLATANVRRLTDEGEIALIRRMAEWPRVVESAAEAHEPHRVAFYLYDLASAFHAQWNRGNENEGLRFIASGDGELTAARLALVRAVATVIASGLGVMGVAPVEEMR